MTRSSKKVSSRRSKSTRRPQSIPKGCTRDLGSISVEKSRADQLSPQLPETQLSITPSTAPTLVRLYSTSPLLRRMIEQRLSDKQASPPTASTAPSTVKSVRHWSVTFDPDGSRFLRRVTSSVKVSTYRRSKWASRFVPHNPSSSICSKRVEFYGPFRVSPWLHFSTTPETCTASDYPPRYERGVFLALMRALTALSVSQACASAHSVGQRTPLGLWSVSAVAPDLRPNLVRWWRQTAHWKNIQRQQRNSSRRNGSARSKVAKIRTKSSSRTGK